MKAVKLVKNIKTEVYRIDKVTVKYDDVVYNLIVYYSNIEIDKWDGATKKDINKLRTLTEDDRMEIRKLLEEFSQLRTAKIV